MYAFRTCAPDDTKELAMWADDQTRTVLRQLFGSDIDSDDPIVSLPIRYGGLGIPKNCDIHAIAFHAAESAVSRNSQADGIQRAAHELLIHDQLKQLISTLSPQQKNVHRSFVEARSVFSITSRFMSNFPAAFRSHVRLRLSPLLMSQLHCRKSRSSQRCFEYHCPRAEGSLRCCRRAKMA